MIILNWHLSIILSKYVVFLLPFSDSDWLPDQVWCHALILTSCYTTKYTGLSSHDSSNTVVFRADFMLFSLLGLSGSGHTNTRFFLFEIIWNNSKQLLQMYTILRLIETLTFDTVCFDSVWSWNCGYIWLCDHSQPSNNDKWDQYTSRVATGIR